MDVLAERRDDNKQLAVSMRETHYPEHGSCLKMVDPRAPIPGKSEPLRARLHLTELGTIVVAENRISPHLA